MILKQFRTFISLYPTTTTIFLCIVILGACAILWRDSITTVFKRIRTQEETLSYKHIRVPISEEEDTYKRIRVAYPTNRDKVRFQLAPMDKALINVGVVRNHSDRKDLKEIRFIAYKKGWLRKKIYVNVIGQFAPGEQANYLIKDFPFSMESEANEIFCEIGYIVFSN